MSTDNAFSLKNNKPIYDINKFTHLDYPEHLAAIFWFTGCNMRCDYCYNRDIVFAHKGAHSFEDALAFLQTRVNLLDAVILSGGEATNHDLTSFCQKIQSLGFLVKLDTNGTNYKQLHTLITNNLIDYVALDYKAPKDKFTDITHSHNYDDFSKSLNLLINANISFEVRTTLHADLLNEEDINAIIFDLKSRGYNKPYYLQAFLETGDNIGNLPTATNNFDATKLSQSLEIVWR